MDNIFLQSKIIFLNAAAHLATITATRWTGNRHFFVDSPSIKFQKDFF